MAIQSVIVFYAIFSGIMRKTSSEKALLCRYGGEEFAVIIKDGSIQEATNSQRFRGTHQNHYSLIWNCML